MSNARQLQYGNPFQNETQNSCALCGPRKETDFLRSRLAQLKVAGACYILSIAYGMSMGHTSALLKELTSNHTSILNDKDTAKWIDLVQLMAVPVGCLLGGLCMDRWGRQRVILGCSGIFAFGWWLITGAQNHAMIFIGRIVNGFCSGSIITSMMVIIVEYCDYKRRAPIMIAIYIFAIVGCVIMYGLGLFLDWRVTSGIAGLLPLSAIFAFYFLPESAVWLVKKYRMIEARRTLLWIHGPKRVHQAEIEHEDMVHRRRMDEIETFRKFAGRRTSVTLGPFKHWKTLTSKHILKPFVICLIFNVISTFFGTFFFIRFAIRIYNYERDNLRTESHIILLLMYVLRLPGLIALTVLLHWTKRRTLSISSGIICFILSLTIGTLDYISKSDHSSTSRWIMLLLIVLYVTSDSWGFHALPIIMTAELMHGKARGVLCGIIYAINGILICVEISINGIITDFLEAYELFWIISIFCFGGSFFVCLFLPETRGQSLINLEDFYRSAHVLWVLRKSKLAHGRRVAIRLKEIT